MIDSSWFENIEKKVEEELAARRAREEEAANRRPPNLKPNDCLVAFIDILGFKHEIENAKTEDELLAIYRKVRLVQQELQKESAAIDPDEQAQFNADYGRRVIALSDAVVVVISPNNRASAMMGGYDHLGFVVFELMLAQARCVANHGIFLRGGLSHGSFFFEDDVLLSPALARAYELESKYADHPIIVVPEETCQFLLGSPKKSRYAPDVDPMPKQFALHGARLWRERPLYFLDYLEMMVEEEYDWFREDHQDYLDAREKDDHERAEAALNRRQQKGVASFLRGHRRRIEAAYTAADAEKVRAKYRWLMHYHNQAFSHEVPYVRDQIIDLAQFSPPTKAPSNP